MNRFPLRWVSHEICVRKCDATYIHTFMRFARIDMDIICVRAYTHVRMYMQMINGVQLSELIKWRVRRRQKAEGDAT